jgi:carbon-monoxide dehydrogenase large subunit
MSRFGIGQPVRRVEDARFLTGSGRYLDDLNQPHQLHGHLLFSPYAHAKIKSIDTSRAEKAPGVACVLTGKDIVAAGLGALPPNFMPEDMGGPKGHRAVRPVLCQDRLRHVGDRVAFIVAETLAQARDAAELIELEVEELPAVTTVEDAIKPGAPQIYEQAPGNLCVPLMFGNKQAADEAFAKAKHTVKLKVENNRLVANAMEPRGAIGVYNAFEDSYTLYTSTQNPHGVRSMLCGPVFKMPETKLRVVANDVGGGFGMKGDTYPEEALVLLAAKRCGRPVKWINGRSDGFVTDDCGRDSIIDAEMAFDDAGRVQAIRATALQNFGAYAVGAAVVTLIYSVKLMTGVYDVPAVHVATKAIFTNTTPMGPYRGAGRPEANYIIERLMDDAAKKLNMDPAEFRRRNYIQNGAFPYKTGTGFIYDSGDFANTADQGLKLADWPGYGKRVEASKKAGKLRGRAMIYYIEDAGIFNERMELRFDPSGMVTIVAGTFSHGQSHATTFAQCVSDWLGVPFENIRFVQGDTDQVSFGRGTYASRSGVVGSGALRAAADAIIDKGKKFAGFLMEASPGDIVFEAGKFKVTGTDKAVTIIDVARTAYRPAGLPKELGMGLEAAGAFAPEPPSYPNGCHLCEVEVDPETGVVTVERYAAVDDVGKVINPLIVDGQIHGGVAQGLGQALLEKAIFDPAGGQLLSGSFTDYGMPRADDMPPAFEVEYNEVLCKTNPLGVKGAGEAGTCGAPPAIMNAILDALQPLGVQHIDMPATPRRVWEAIKAARPI